MLHAVEIRPFEPRYAAPINWYKSMMGVTDSTKISYS